MGKVKTLSYEEKGQIIAFSRNFWYIGAIDTELRNSPKKIWKILNNKYGQSNLQNQTMYCKVKRHQRRALINISLRGKNNARELLDEFNLTVKGLFVWNMLTNSRILKYRRILQCLLRIIDKYAFAGRATTLQGGIISGPKFYLQMNKV